MAPRSLLVNADTHPADESRGAFGGSLERGVDGVSGNANDVGSLACDPCRLGPTLLFFLLQFVVQAFVYAEAVFENQ